MHKIIPFFLILYISFLGNTFAQIKAVTLESDGFKYEVASDGKNLSFIDKKSGKDYCDHARPSVCAQLKKDGKSFDVSKVTSGVGRITLEFSAAGITAFLKSTVKGNYILLEVESVKGGEIESLIFVNIPLILKGLPAEPFAACSFSLNLYTQVDQLPALQSCLWASCYQKFGINGARIALIGVPQADILPTLRQVLSTEAGDMPYSTVAGPWAQDIPYNHGSYLFNFGDLTEDTVDEWIKMAKSGGFTQIENHGGSAGFFQTYFVGADFFKNDSGNVGFFKFGDFEL
ncbi:MAG: hypothetical protein WCU00_11715, partial [Candidatus Latescibacterota bacterium]